MIERVAASTVEENADRFLRPYDIVLIIKGSVGKVGIVPSDVPEPGPGSLMRRYNIKPHDCARVL
jgi:hypothetical protein